jgi:hypothetical protein
LASHFDELDQDHNGRLTVFELHHPPGTTGSDDAGAADTAAPVAPDAGSARGLPAVSGQRTIDI